MLDDTKHLWPTFVSLDAGENDGLARRIARYWFHHCPRWQADCEHCSDGSLNHSTPQHKRFRLLCIFLCPHIPFDVIWNRVKCLQGFLLLLLLLNGNHRHLRQHWCEERRTWRTESNGIAFTNKFRFYLQLHDGQILVWRRHVKRLLHCCVMHRHTDPAIGIMV